MKLHRLVPCLFAIALISGCSMAGPGAQGPKVSILVDLDPASADRTVIIENLTVDGLGIGQYPAHRS